MQYKVNTNLEQHQCEKVKLLEIVTKRVTWYKPKICPKGLSKDGFDALLQTITVRKIYYYIIIPRFRTPRVSLITTLLDPTTYPPLEIVVLYGKRWGVEVNLKHLKTTLEMDVLRCKTHSMVRKKIYVYLLVYNLLRSLIWSDGTAYCAPPLRLSIHRHSSSFNQFYSQFIICFSGATRPHLSHLTKNYCSQACERSPRQKYPVSP